MLDKVTAAQFTSGSAFIACILKIDQLISHEMRGARAEFDKYDPLKLGMDKHKVAIRVAEIVEKWKRVPGQNVRTSTP